MFKSKQRAGPASGSARRVCDGAAPVTRDLRIRSAHARITEGGRRAGLTASQRGGWLVSDIKSVCHSNVIKTLRWLSYPFFWGEMIVRRCGFFRRRARCGWFGVQRPNG